MKRIQAGFTLIELMIVVAIIGILAAIAIPAYNGYIDNAKKDKVLANFESGFREVTNEVKKDTTAVNLGVANGNFFRSVKTDPTTRAATQTAVIAYLNGAHDGETAKNFAPNLTAANALAPAYTAGTGAVANTTQTCTLTAAQTLIGQVGIVWNGVTTNAGPGVAVCLPAFGPAAEPLTATTKNVKWE